MFPLMKLSFEVAFMQSESPPPPFPFSPLISLVVLLCGGLESNFVSLAWLVYQLKESADNFVCASP